ncbi:MAG TPA: lysophospholipid acyltransferase family protein [Solirubrobacteraceae bacterium]
MDREELDRIHAELNRLHERARTRGVNPIVYWITRAIIQPFFHLYFRLSRIGRENIPTTGGVIFASNHRSFLDPFIIGVLTRRPVYYVAKSEIFKNPLVAWFVSSLGAFPVRRGAGDPDMMETARAILERGECVLIFPEGTRTRPGSLARPKRGVGRLALETGAPVVPVALIGTEAVRKGWRIRPKKVRARIGRPLTFPKVDPVSPQLAAAVTDRIWPNVMLQWEWLGGLLPLRRAVVVGTGEWAESIAGALRRAKIEVDLDAADHSRHDLVVFAGPAGELADAVAAHGPRIAHRTGVLVAVREVMPDGTLPTAFVSQHVSSWALGALAGDGELERRAPVQLATDDAAFARQAGDALRAAGLDVTRTPLADLRLAPRRFAPAGEKSKAGAGRAA